MRTAAQSAHAVAMARGGAYAAAYRTMMTPVWAESRERRMTQDEFTAGHHEAVRVALEAEAEIAAPVAARPEMSASRSYSFADLSELRAAQATYDRAHGAPVAPIAPPPVGAEGPDDVDRFDSPEAKERRKLTKKALDLGLTKGKADAMDLDDLRAWVADHDGDDETKAQIAAFAANFAGTVESAPRLAPGALAPRMVLPDWIGRPEQTASKRTSPVNPSLPAPRKLSAEQRRAAEAGCPQIDAVALLPLRGER